MMQYLHSKETNINFKYVHSFFSHNMHSNAINCFVNYMHQMQDYLKNWVYEENGREQQMKAASLILAEAFKAHSKCMKYITCPKRPFIFNSTKAGQSRLI